MDALWRALHDGVPEPVALTVRHQLLRAATATVEGLATAALRETAAGLAAPGGLGPLGADVPLEPAGGAFVVALAAAAGEPDVATLYGALLGAIITRDRRLGRCVEAFAAGLEGAATAPAPQAPLAAALTALAWLDELSAASAAGRLAFACAMPPPPPNPLGAALTAANATLIDRTPGIEERPSLPGAATWNGWKNVADVGSADALPAVAERRLDGRISLAAARRLRRQLLTGGAGVSARAVLCERFERRQPTP